LQFLCACECAAGEHHQEEQPGTHRP
jgi:hypothetical protein